MRRIGRHELRKVRDHRAHVRADNRTLDYDCISRMNAIDAMSQPLRDLVNEHGFVAVVKALQETTDIRQVTRILQQRWHNRQQQLANGSY